MYYVTLSRKAGTGGTEIAQRAAKQLGYSFYDTEDIEKKAAEMGFLDDVRAIDEKAPPPMKRLFSYRPEVSLERLYVVIYELARQGNAVILGRGGNMLFRSLPYALHVRVIASKEKRVAELARRGYTRQAALLVAEKSDHERASFIKFAFHRDWENPELYDLVINTDALAVDTAVEMIVCAARARELQTASGDVEGSLAMMELAAKIGTALTEAGFPSSYISSYVVAPGKVRLTGVVQVPWERSAAERAALDVKGVESVENNIEIAGR